MKAAHICPFPNESYSRLCVFADLPAPESGRPVPRVITFQRKRANRRVINEDQLVRMLREFAEVTCHPSCCCLSCFPVLTFCYVFACCYHLTAVMPSPFWAQKN